MSPRGLPSPSTTDAEVADVGTARSYLLKQALLFSDLAPGQPLAGSHRRSSFRIGDLVVQQFCGDRNHHQSRPSDVAALMGRAGPLAPGVVHIDDDRGVLVSTFSFGRHWGRLLASGNIDFRTYATLGRTIRHLHERLARSTSNDAPIDGAGRIPVEAAGSDLDLRRRLYLVGDRLEGAQPMPLHGNLSPDNIVLGQRGNDAAIFTGWAGTGVGDPILDLATLLADGVAHSIREPHTFDSYVDAGRQFLESYGDVSTEWLTEVIGALLLVRGHRDHDVALYEHARGLLVGGTSLPW
jgi:hypothetical protein